MQKPLLAALSLSAALLTAPAMAAEPVSPIEPVEVKNPALVERIPRAFPIHVAHMGGVKRGWRSQLMHRFS